MGPALAMLEGRRFSVAGVPAPKAPFQKCAPPSDLFCRNAPQIEVHF